LKYILWIFLCVAGVIFALIYLFGYTKLHLGTLYSYLLAINTTTFIYYALDKLFAKANRVRIPETALHIMEFIGGSPSALVAQQLFWHKSTKRSYQVVFWLIIVVQLSSMYVLFYTDLLKNIF